MSRRIGKRDEETTCIFRVIRVSGTIKKAEEEAIRRARKQILTASSEQNNTFDSMFSKKGDDEEIDPEEDLMMEDYDTADG